MKIHNTCFDIIKNYNGFLVDIWGVLHSSGIPYPNAFKALEVMMEIGEVILLSNAPRRAKKVEDFLDGIGFKKSIHFNDILTSGEAFIKDTQTNGYHQVFYMGPERDLDILDNTNISVTQNIDDYFNDAILTGLVEDNNNLEPDIRILKQLLHKNTVVSCINPDIVVKSGNYHQLCAGAVAKEYEKMGGMVKYFGKPHQLVYSIAFKMLEDRFAIKSKAIDKSQILAIGDGMETDILGATNFGIDSVLCITGIHQNAIHFNGIQNFLEEFLHKPTFVIDAL